MEINNAAARNEEKAVQPKTNWSLTDAFSLANTLANHGWTCDANPDAASSCIYALCRLLKDGVNMAAMREALEEARKVVKAMGGYWARETLPIIDAALSAPPRQCDVGTAEEQARRFKEFCAAHWSINNVDSECAGCPLTIEGAECEFAWAQMPYDEPDTNK